MFKNSKDDQQMEKKHLGISREITAKNEYTLDSLFNVLKEQAKFEAGEPVRYSSMGMQFLKLPGKGGLDNLISVKGNKITVFGHHASTLNKFLAIALDAIPDGWSSILGLDRKQNDPIMDAIVAEI